MKLSIIRKIICFSGLSRIKIELVLKIEIGFEIFMSKYSPLTIFLNLPFHDFNLFSVVIAWHSELSILIFQIFKIIRIYWIGATREEIQFFFFWPVESKSSVNFSQQALEIPNGFQIWILDHSTSKNTWIKKKKVLFYMLIAVKVK